MKKWLSMHGAWRSSSLARCKPQYFGARPPLRCDCFAGLCVGGAACLRAMLRVVDGLQIQRASLERGVQRRMQAFERLLHHCGYFNACCYRVGCGLAMRVDFKLQALQACAVLGGGLIDNLLREVAAQQLQLGRVINCHFSQRVNVG